MLRRLDNKKIITYSLEKVTNGMYLNDFKCFTEHEEMLSRTKSITA